MRYILYLLCIIILLFRDYLFMLQPEVTEKLSALYLLAFTFVCIDIAVRIRRSAYLFFPVAIAAALYLNMTGLGQPNYYSFAYSALYLIISVLLVRKAVSAKTAGEKSVATTFYAMAAMLLILGLKIVTLMADVSFLAKIYDLQIPNYLVAGYAGGILLAKKLPEKYKEENELFLFLVFLNVIAIARALVAGMAATGVNV